MKGYCVLSKITDLIGCEDLQFHLIDSLGNGCFPSAMPSIQTNLGVRSASSVVDGGNKRVRKPLRIENYLDVIFASNWPCFSASFCLSAFFLWLIFFLAFIVFRVPWRMLSPYMDKAEYLKFAFRLSHYNTKSFPLLPWLGKSDWG